MACVTLKRSAAFEMLGPAAPKRHRCSMNLPCNCQLPVEQSVFTPSSQLTKSQIHRRIREEVKRLQRRRAIPRFPLDSLPPSFETSNVDRPNSPEESGPLACAQVITSMRYMAIRSPKADSQASASDSDDCEAPSSPISRRSLTDSLISQPQSPENSTIAPLSSSPTSSTVFASAAPVSQDSVPLFTLPQVTTLCDRLIREREEQLREEYDNILSCKLAEQYEALLKYNQDQLSHRFKNSPMSYVS